MHYPGIQIEAIAEVLSENVGFASSSGNPNLSGWCDIVEFLFADERIKTALIERYADRLSEYADRIDEAYDRDRDRRDEGEEDRRLNSHWVQLAEAITRQEARRITEGRTI